MNSRSEKNVIASLKLVLEQCEETGQFTANSRRFYGVGEWLLAFEGIYRFVEGNVAFKAFVEPAYGELLELFRDDLDLSRLPPRAWKWRK
ncbi:hypothetical protein FEE96_08040 [Parasedimentitalea maritima]|uniref:Uncharacterized protein n=1 Tax=Parasedimentitalea maritima TaxID=2578117 RepID=A0ABY2UXD0_9RHOB|nr:hypothetical protein FEE96_08040 [Zongyanglinia marina]